MSMPVFPETPDIGREEAINLILASVAYEELGLSHIINAEGEKIQRVVALLEDQEDFTNSALQALLQVNESVQNMLTAVRETESLLMEKMTAALAADTGA